MPGLAYEADPDWRRQGLGTESVRWMRTRVQVLHAERHSDAHGDLRPAPFEKAYVEATCLAHNEAFKDHCDFTEANEEE